LPCRLQRRLKRTLDRKKEQRGSQRNAGDDEEELAVRDAGPVDA
jgi:hypothetical protein